MAPKSFLRDLSQLRSGNLSDLTLNFGGKAWQIHRALASCHSKWFDKAITIGFEETNSGVVTLEDDIEFAEAIDCMVSYFYEAGYKASTYSTSEPLLHAQVAIIADKYICASLYELARTSFAETVKAVTSNDWPAIAAFIYDHTTAEVPAHVELRSLVVATFTSRLSPLKSALRIGSIEELLRSIPDLAIDLLQGGQTKEHGSEHIFMCDRCHYVHVGSRNCPNVVSTDDILRGCRQCGTTSKSFKHKTICVSAFSCPSCDGIHTAAPKSKPNEDEAVIW